MPAVAAMSTSASDAEPTSKAAHYAAALGGVLAGIFGASCVASANEAADGLHAPHYPWGHEGVLDSYDHAAIRRGHKVRGLGMGKPRTQARKGRDVAKIGCLASVAAP